MSKETEAPTIALTSKELEMIGGILFAGMQLEASGLVEFDKKLFTPQSVADLGNKIARYEKVVKFYESKTTPAASEEYFDRVSAQGKP